MVNWCYKHHLFEICPECMREQREARAYREEYERRIREAVALPVPARSANDGEVNG